MVLIVLAGAILATNNTARCTTLTGPVRGDSYKTCIHRGGQRRINHCIVVVLGTLPSLTGPDMKSVSLVSLLLLQLKTPVLPCKSHLSDNRLLLM
jgi:hypothetical protein